MMRQVEAGKADGLLAWHPDRLARNSVDGGRIIYLVDIGKITDMRFPTYRFENTAQGKFMLSIMFGQSKYYVDNLAENVKRGYREKLRRGGWPGLAPLGYLNDEQHQTIVVDPERAILVRTMFEIYARGNHSLAELESAMARLGLTSKRAGKPVRKNKLDEMLRNPLYYGVMLYNDETYEGNHPPLISKTLFDQAQKALALRSKPHVRGRKTFALKGLARCAECGGSITAEVQKGYTYYHCTKRIRACPQRYVREEALLAQIREIILSVSVHSELADELRTRWKN
jgi:DNA invertase Pin-like site-specific DNA recombinase